MTEPSQLPLAGLRVLDFGHTVMGPACALILADLGASVIKIEPAPAGDPTRRLQGFGTGYFGYFNRNKRSIAIDLKTPEGLAVGRKLIERADILIENFAPKTMQRLGLDYDTVHAANPRLIYASLKGFLPGPYAQRSALDEVVQMMAGLAYMTGPSGRPLRAGTSVVDIVGGMFAVIAIMAALRERERTGRGQRIESALFESTVFLMGQHLCYASQTDGPIPPMPERVSAWAVYDLFDVKDEQQVFVGITTDSQWQRFCQVIQRPDLAHDPDFATNNLRIQQRPRLLSMLKALFSSLDLQEACSICEAASVSFAPIARPEHLFDDPHLSATGGLMPTTLTNGIQTRLPRLPITLADTEFSIREQPPQIGQHTDAIMRELGYSDEMIEDFYSKQVVSTSASTTDGVCS